MAWSLRFGAASLPLLALLVLPNSGHAEELEGGVRINAAGIVEVEVFRENGKPAVGVKVALREAKKDAIAQGKINADGQWSWPAPKAGSYEVVIDPGTGEKDKLVWPLDVREQVDISKVEEAKKCEHCEAAAKAVAEVASVKPAPPEERFPWLAIGVSLGFVGLAGLAFWFGRPRARPAGEGS